MMHLSFVCKSGCGEYVDFVCDFSQDRKLIVCSYTIYGSQLLTKVTECLVLMNKEISYDTITLDLFWQHFALIVTGSRKKDIEIFVMHFLKEVRK